MVEAIVSRVLSGDGRLVSIPERVLGWLKHVNRVRNLIDVAVSIPERVLGWLKPQYPISLQEVRTVSIPERVLGWLKRDLVE